MCDSAPRQIHCEKLAEKIYNMTGAKTAVIVNSAVKQTLKSYRDKTIGSWVKKKKKKLKQHHYFSC